MAKPYFILAGYDETPPAAPSWAVEFGDYDRETVDAEREEYRAKGWKPKALRVLKVTASNGRKVMQVDINAAIARLNAGA